MHRGILEHSEVGTKRADFFPVPQIPTRDLFFYPFPNSCFRSTFLTRKTKTVFKSETERKILFPHYSVQLHGASGIEPEVENILIQWTMDLIPIQAQSI